MKRTALFVFLAVASQSHAAPLELRKGDHICIIGNTLADRMQHYGWLEARLAARFPEHELVVRNLGFSGDELTLRLRSAGFGSPDEWLARCKTDVVFAFFGYNESFAGSAGLERFKHDLTAFIKRTLAQKYNGRAAPRLVLFSPIAIENLKNRNLPDGALTNERIGLYADAMAQVARANGVAFVDLFGPTRELYSKSEPPLSINGLHLTEHGDRLLADVIDRALFGEAPAIDAAKLEKIRGAVLEKNLHWFNRYRTTDGYSIHGGRADLRFVGGQTNRVVMQREMEVLDVLTANRDRGIWAAARGEDVKFDDGNTPPFLEVVTNKPGPLPGGKHVFLAGQEAISKMTLAKGLKVELFASEEAFPELVNPVQMAFDTKGRLWVAAWPTYPHWKPKEPMNDKLLILEDTNGDGRADRCKTFAGDLHNPTGFEFYNGGVIVAMAPNLLFLKDTDGDDRADTREILLSGLDTADTHHTANSFTLDPGGAIYFQEGTFHHTQVETRYGPPVRCVNAGVFRYEPLTHRFEVYVSYPFANPHGHVFDRWGQDIVVDGTGSNPYHGALFSGHVNYPDKHHGTPQVYQQWTRPCPAIEYVTGRHFPDEMQGHLLVANVIGYQGILQYKIADQGASFSGQEGERLLFSSDPNFRPADMEFGPDGALYFTDWHNPIIGHMQHNLRDPSRDRTHGRVYRVTYPGRPLVEPVAVAGQPIEKLLDLLKDTDNRLRYRARIELSSRNSDEVIAAAEKWLSALDRSAADFEHHQLEALWLHQFHNVVNTSLLDRVLASSDFRARSAATRVLCYWRDRVSNSLELLKKLAADPHPRVRLEAIRAASFFTAPDAVEVPLIAAEHPRDTYLDYVSKETMRTLEPTWKKEVAAGRTVPVTTEAGARFFLRNMSTPELLKAERSRVVCLELLYRPGLQDEPRRAAVAQLAKIDRKSELAVVLEAIRGIDTKTENRDESVVFDLLRLLTARRGGELAAARAEIEKLALSARLPVIRQIGFVSLISLDASTDKAWALASQSIAALQDLAAAMPLVSDASLRASLYSRIEPLLHGLPANLAPKGSSGRAAYGRFVRVELSGARTLSLAEVEVYSDGRNVARAGKASQKNATRGGEARRAIDGNTSGRYTDGGMTHTREQTPDPWWEVDLGDEFPIDSIVIYNRTEGELGKRLDNFALKVLDESRSEVFAKTGNPAPATKVDIALPGGGPAGVVRRAAMNALVSVRGQETKTFQTLSKFVTGDIDRLAAIRALQRIPRAAWPKEEATPLLTAVLASIRKIPVSERTSPAALDTLEFADALTTLLPPDEARKIRAKLAELGVRVIRIGTVLERMAYDKETVVVKAGKPVEIVLENTDLMPHNFVITRPGAMEEIGQAAEATATQPDAQARNFVPPSNKILLASRLLQPRQSQKLSFTPPSQPGVYPYVCTYPGHWRRMYGAMYVVEDLDQYLANPEAYLAAHPLRIKDDLLKDRRARTEWKFEDLAAAVEGLEHGRSHGNGKQMFQVAACIACHKLEGAGTDIGPDLAKLDPKYKPIDILRELLDPSAKINEKFQSYGFETDSGSVVTGLIVEETPDVVKIVENPLVKAQAVELKKSEIIERKKAPTSIMPKGLLDKLTREEILDLIAYLAARGNSQDKLFQGEGHHHH
jgi:putative heme-binding domain-containing protein